MLINKQLFFFLCLFLIPTFLLGQDAFITTWQTDNAGISNDNQITIPGFGNYDIYWEEVANATNNGTAVGDSTTTLTLPNIGTYRIEITGGLGRIAFANGGDKIKLLSIEQWGNISWTSMEQAFQGCYNMTYNATDSPDLSGVTNCARTFGACNNFNGAIGSWNVSTITTMQNMLAFCPNFNQDLSSWDVSQVGNFRRMFYNSPAFNQDISNWNTSMATDMSGMFRNSTSFNQDLGNWNIEQVLDMTEMLDSCGLSSFNYDAILINWATQNLNNNITLGATDLEYCNATNARNTLLNTYNWIINGDLLGCPFITTWQTDKSGTSNDDQITIPGIGNYDIYWEEVGNAANNGTAVGDSTATLTFPNIGIYQVYLHGGLEQIRINNGGDRLKLLSVDQWGDIAWTSMDAAFRGCSQTTFTATDVPDLSNVTDCSNAFGNCRNFNFSLELWDVSNVTDMGSMFFEAEMNVDIGFWDVSNVTNMGGMFSGSNFNQDISTWDVSNVTNMNELFQETNFNQDISSWDVSKVTNMGSMFGEADAFDQDISSWDVSKVTDMGNMFWSADAFNQDISSWDVSKVTIMRSMFVNADAFNQDIGSWDVSKVTDMRSMFGNADAFNQDISSWDVSKVTDMRSMFSDAAVFNQDISSWDVSKVTEMRSMFEDAAAFNQDIGSWDVSKVTNMGRMFENANAFDQNLGSWNLMSLHAPLNPLLFMFQNSSLSRSNYDATLIGWASQDVPNNLKLGAQGRSYCIAQAARDTLINVHNWIIQGDALSGDCSTPFITTWVSNKSGTSDDDQITIPAIGTYTIYWKNINNASQQELISDVSGTHTITFPQADTFRVSIYGDLEQIRFNLGGDRKKLLSVDQWGDIAWTSMNAAFRGCYQTTFAATDVPDLSNVTDCSNAFQSCHYFNSSLSLWDVSNVTNMSRMFFEGSIQENIGSWDVSQVTDMSHMFNSTPFNQDIGSWNVSQVTDMSSMFFDAAAFNQDIGTWDVSQVTNMSGMFESATAFNQDIRTWDVSQVTDMSYMFSDAAAFNQDIGTWDVSQVTDMSNMFNDAVVFNQDIGSWDVSQVTNMESMFENAGVFNQDIGSWNLMSLQNNLNPLLFIFKNSSLSRSNYDATLIGWASQDVPNNLTLGAQGRSYCIAQAARDTLINVHNWTIQGDWLAVDCGNTFVTTWLSNKSGSSNDNQITIPAIGTYTIYWENTGNANQRGRIVDVNDTHTITFPQADTFKVSIYGDLEQIRFNNGGDRLKLLSVDQWGDIAWTSMNAAFMGCSQTTFVATDVPDLSNVLDCSNAFEDCRNFNFSLELWDVSNVTNMSAMFKESDMNEAIDFWNVSQVTNMASMFTDAAFFNQDIGGWDVSQVTDMSSMFEDASIFNQDIGGWDVSQVTNMASTFGGEIAFNQDIGTWNVSQVTDMKAMFASTLTFNQDIGGWDVSQVTDMSVMFINTRAFNQDIGEWDVSQVTDMENMFEDAEAFDQNLGSWNLMSLDTSANPLSDMFKNSSLSQSNYDVTLLGWASQDVPNNLTLDAHGLTYCAAQEARDSLINVHNWTINGDALSGDCNTPFVTTWVSNKSGTSDDDQITIPAIGTYTIYWKNISNASQQGLVSDVSGTHTITFPQADTFRVSIYGDLEQIRFNDGGDKLKLLSVDQWGDIVWTSMNAAFMGCSQTTFVATDVPDLSNVLDCSNAFQDCRNFNFSLELWDVSNVTNMSEMFFEADMNEAIGWWDVSNVTDMNGLFEETNFNQDIGGWDVSQVTDMSYMFFNATVFNQDIGNWDVSQVTDMVAMFENAGAFNQDIGAWDVSQVTDMSNMFFNATAFNEDIGNWDVSQVTDMSWMFWTTTFNQDIGGWDVSQVMDMSHMFSNATGFNQDIGNWNVSQVETMRNMFDGATAFDQSLGNWNLMSLNNNIDPLNLFLSNSGLSRINYDATLIGWASQDVPNNLALGAQGLIYCAAQDARDSLINAHNWIINGDALDCPSIHLSAKMLLEGALFNGSDLPNTMNDDLRDVDLLPTTSPYIDSLTCDPTVFDVLGADAIVDWVWLELRDANDHTQVIASRSALLQRDGDVVDIDGTSVVLFIAEEDHYFIALGHRNHLAIMSANTFFISSIPITFDATLSINDVMGGANSVVSLPEGNALFAGDVDTNSQVQNTDVSALLPELGTASYSPADVDMNGQIQNAELNNLLRPNIGRGQQF